jgi:ribosomal protein L32
MIDVSYETVKKVSEFAGFKISHHSCMEKNTLTGQYDKIKKQKVYKTAPYKSYELSPCNQYKPWEDTAESINLIDTLDPHIFTINMNRNKSGEWECEIQVDQGFIVSFTHKLRETAIYMAIVELLNRQKNKMIIHVTAFKAIGDYSYAKHGYCPDCGEPIIPDHTNFKVNIDGEIYDWHVDCYNESHP